jgi:hypothetical protein
MENNNNNLNNNIINLINDQEGHLTQEEFRKNVREISSDFLREFNEVYNKHLPLLFTILKEQNFPLQKPQEKFLTLYNTKREAMPRKTMENGLINNLKNFNFQSKASLGGGHLIPVAVYNKVGFCVFYSYNQGTKVSFLSMINMDTGKPIKLIRLHGVYNDDFKKVKKLIASEIFDIMGAKRHNHIPLWNEAHVSNSMITFSGQDGVNLNIFAVGGDVSITFPDNNQVSTKFVSQRQNPREIEKNNRLIFSTNKDGIYLELHMIITKDNTIEVINYTYKKGDRNITTCDIVDKSLVQDLNAKLQEFLAKPKSSGINFENLESLKNENSKFEEVKQEEESGNKNQSIISEMKFDGQKM